ncbi:SLC13 family permease [Clostridium estertheticum]|uniref:SLC13 family permease n=1 Tax=Clostridium estertheticum TaxID=238834 RepID=UPI001C6F5320|nr:SLC13 family permease [Clostridium estertheticum]MBW9150886.1 anion transporter [Clostridium estertheticum]WLC84392.1 anion transporter [Clostridium estertheticum]
MLSIGSLKNNIAQILIILKKDLVFSLALALSVITSFFSTPKIEYIDFKVLFTLFNLMLIVSAFKHMKVLDKLAVTLLIKYDSSKKISFILIYLTFFSSMLITNDVALITFVPLALIISKRASISPMKLVIFQTLAANIGSGLTPMGNPQNLFLFSYYRLTGFEFLKTMISFTLLGIIWLFILNNLGKNKKLKFDLDNIIIESKVKVMIFSLLFIFIILSVFNIINYKLAFIITLLTVLILNKKLLLKVDYILLLTFVCFFVFIGNLSSLPFIKSLARSFLQNKTTTYFSSIILSQVVSNVPCSILLANFTSNWRELLLGVNIGGLGTLVASLASVISYKLYIKKRTANAQSRYLTLFTLYNLISLLVFTFVLYFIFIF